MRSNGGKARGVIKGAPSGLVISLFVHAAAFVLAGLLVVFTVQHREEKKFVPPKPVDRPKMKLKKPKVKVKKSAKPKATSRIVTKVQKATMPDIQLPEMGGVGDGLAGGIGGFEIQPDLGEFTIMGAKNSIGSDLEGTFYDLNRSRGGHPTGIDVTSWREEFRKFLLSGWKSRTLTRYYRYPQKLYATSLVFPPAPSSIAPSAFGDRDASGAYWIVHYKGQIVHSEGITFRFWVNSDENLAIRIDREIVVANTWNGDSGEPATDPNPVAGLWETSDMMKSHRYFMGNNKAVVGDWITLEPGVPVDMEMVIGDNGGQACFIVAVEEEGVDYPQTYQGGPLLPAFKTAEFTRDMRDIIYKNLVDGEISLMSGPVFNDYGSAQNRDQMSIEPSVELVEVPAGTDKKPVRPKYRSWQLASGQIFEARFISMIGDKAVLEGTKGKQVRVPLEEFTKDDFRDMELQRPPKLKIDLIKSISTKTFAMDHISTSSEIRPPEKRGHFGMKFSQTSAGTYGHELFAECFVIGQERLGQKYILMDRHTTSFVPEQLKGKKHESLSERQVVLENFVIDSEPRGETYATYLITVTDERGEIIAMSAPSAWLYENLDNLKKLQPGNYLNKTCERVYPTRPPRTRY